MRKNIRPDSMSHLDPVNLALSKSFGVTIRRLRETLEDAKLSKNFIEQYEEMMRASHETFDRFGDVDERQTKDNGGSLKGLLKGARDRRRALKSEPSPLGKRRARSQANRLGKLRAQGMRNHLEHTKSFGIDELLLPH